MFSKQKPLEQRLVAVLEKYQQQADRNPEKLRQKIPSQEIWRFGVEKSVQMHGRGLMFSPTFVNLRSSEDHADFLAMRVKDFLDNLDDIFDAENIEEVKQQFLKELQESRWDKVDQQFTLQDMLNLDKGLVPFEINEPGYLKGIYKAFQLVMAQSARLDIPFIQYLHRTAMLDVKGSNYDHDQQGLGAFRRFAETGFRLTPQCASKGGVAAFLKNKKDYQYLELRVVEDAKVVGAIEISNESLKLIQEYASDDFEHRLVGARSEVKFAEYCHSPDAKAAFIKKIKEDAQLNKQILKLGETPDKAMDELYKIIRASGDGRLQLCYVCRIAADEIVNELSRQIGEYQAAILQATKPIDKIKAIAKFVVDSELLHPFHDANGRIFCMLVINFLLLEQGFPLSLLEDSNRFNFYTIDELTDEIIKGFENTFELIEKGVIFNISTADIITLLQSKPEFKNLFDYFKGVVAIEEKGRRPSPLLNQ